MNARNLQTLRVLHEAYGGERGQQATFTIQARDKVEAMKSAREKIMPGLEIKGVYPVKSDRSY